MGHGEKKLTAGEYEETSWSARKWLPFARQRVSVALHRAVAWEIGTAMRIPLSFPGARRC